MYGGWEEKDAEEVHPDQFVTVYFFGREAIVRNDMLPEEIEIDMDWKTVVFEDRFLKRDEIIIYYKSLVHFNYYQFKFIYQEYFRNRPIDIRVWKLDEISYYLEIKLEGNYSFVYLCNAYWNKEQYEEVFPDKNWEEYLNELLEEEERYPRFDEIFKDITVSDDMVL